MNQELSVAIDSLPTFNACGRLSLAKLVPNTQSTTLAAGETLFKVDQPANTLFYVISGNIALQSEQQVVSSLTEGFVGEEASMAGARYMSTAIATTSCQLLSFPSSAIQGLIKENSQAGVDFSLSLASHFSGKSSQAAPPKAKTKAGILSSWGDTIGWLLAIVVPALVYFGTTSAAVSQPVANFTTIFTAAIIMWLFDLVPEYVPAIFVIMATIILGLVPTNVVLSGFSSGPFFMALSVFGLGAVLVGSGVTYRFSIALLHRIPPSSMAYDLALFFLGVFLTPLLPTSNGRIVLLTPLLLQISDTAGYGRMGVAATRISVATFAGISLFASSFMTAKSINFALVGLLPAQIKDQFTVGYWLYASLASSFVLFVGHLLLSATLFRSDEQVHLSPSQLVEQLRILGPLNSKEWIAFASVILFVMGILTSSIHKIDPPWIGLAILFLILTIGAISRNDFRRVIDWPFLLLLGSFVGIERSVSYLQIDQLFALHMVFIREAMSGNIYLFILILSAATYLVRLVLPYSVAVILLAAFLMPLAVSVGMNPWIIGFIILLIADGWFFPYQCTYYTQMTAMTQDSPLFNNKSMIIYNNLMNIVRIASVCAAVPFWKAIGLL